MKGCELKHVKVQTDHSVSGAGLVSEDKWPQTSSLRHNGEWQDPRQMSTPAASVESSGIYLQLVWTYKKSGPVLSYLDVQKKPAIWIYMWTVLTWTSLMAQTVKHLSTMQETQVRSLGQEDPLEKEKATHSTIHAWKIPWTEEPGGLQSIGLQKVGHNWITSLHIITLNN